MIVGENIRKKYDSLEVLKGVSLEIQTSEIVSIVGASGAGKSTLLHILGSLDKPDMGKVQINNTNIFELNTKQLAKFRNQYIGFIFQFHNLLPEFTALENVALPALLARTPHKQAYTQANHLLEMLGLAERAKHLPSELSGGEAQRVAVARALVNRPKVIFADEPSGNLDSKNAESLHKLFFQIRQEFQTTFVIVTHSLSLSEMADRTIRLQDGLIITP